MLEPRPTPTRRQEEEAHYLNLARLMSLRGRQVDPAVARQAIGQLEPRQREAVELRWFEGLTATAAAKRMGVSQPRVTKLLQQAQTKLRALLTAN